MIYVLTLLTAVLFTGICAITAAFLLILAVVDAVNIGDDARANGVPFYFQLLVWLLVVFGISVTCATTGLISFTIFTESLPAAFAAAGH